MRRGANEIKMDSLRSVQIMKALIADAQKHTNDSTNVQIDQPDEDNSNINVSKEIENVPDEDVKKNSNQNNNQSPVSVAPIHVPEKPTFLKNQTSAKKNALTSHSSSVEKPNPAPLKTKIIKPPVFKSRYKNQKKNQRQ